MRRQIKWCWCAVLLVSATLHGDEQPQAYVIRGAERFTSEQQDKLKQWLEYGVRQTARVFGEYPFIMQLHLHPRQGRQPVPWANTWRAGAQSVHFYVDSRFPLQHFTRDWTIYHELSHLALPYLGSNHAWFAEGFASFMQYQIMHQTGLLKQTPTQLYIDKLSPHRRWYNSDYSVIDVANRLLTQGKYPAAYWGSAWFFVLADKKLNEETEVDLTQLIARYQSCCRLQDSTLEEVISSLDQLSETEVFENLYQQFGHSAAKEVLPVTD